MNAEAPLFHDTVARLLRGEAPAGPPSDGGRAFAAWAERQRLAPYLFALAESTDDGLAVALRPARLQAAAQTAMREPAYTQLLRAARDAGARPILFKGLGVAHLHYPAPDMRLLGDLDILVRPEDVDRFTAAALALGCRHQHDDPAIVAFFRDAFYNVPLMHPDIGLVEIHYGLYRDCEAALAPALFARAVEVTALGLPLEALAPPDLFLVLAVHWATSDPGSLWVWLLDLVLIGRTLGEDGWRALGDAAERHGLQLYLLAALRVLDRAWAVRFAGAAPHEAALAAALRPREIRALAEIDALRAGVVLPGDRLAMARRLSGRPVQGGLGPLSSLLCHPGAVAEELGVRSTDPGFWWHRVRHAGLRLRRGVTAIGRRRGPDRD